jgi:hypothetical protein
MMYVKVLAESVIFHLSMTVFFFPSCSTKQEWYKLICMDREKGLQKVDSLRKEKEALEMAECTFRPELYGRGNKSSKVMTFKAMVKSYGTWLPKPPDCRLLQGLNENFFQKKVQLKTNNNDGFCFLSRDALSRVVTQRRYSRQTL